MNLNDKDTKCSNSLDPVSKEKVIRLLKENKIIGKFIDIYSLVRIKLNKMLKRKN